ncbi:Restriction endonuclease NaeI [Nocardioides sp. YR527]|nr:NaeI family type II restriction endonuclease [Nocardioides sp. YR527]SDL09287.1 Restriction endonuclease NaeI [Nocardioides sp. YR527]
MPVVQPGSTCQPDTRKGVAPPAHQIVHPDNDADLQAVHKWLLAQPVTDLLRTATDDAVRYILDGARTWRFDLLDPKVDSDERSAVGTKLQYHIIERLGLKKVPPLDTEIVDVAVEIKGTVRDGYVWMIPREGQCQVTLLVRIDPKNHRFAAWLMRTHRVWLTGGDGNQDKKRSTLAGPVRAFAMPVVSWTDLPPEPLRLLNLDQLEVVFGDAGLRKRATALFTYLPETVIPRSSLVTVGAGLHDPMKRIREAKVPLRNDHDLIVLVGTWVDERQTARAFGHDLGEEGWVAVPRSRFAEVGVTVPPLRTHD